MSAAENDAEFAQLATELMAEFGVTALWSQERGSGSWDLADGGSGSGRTDVASASVTISSPVDEKRVLDRFVDAQQGDFVAYAKPSDLADGAGQFTPEPGAVCVFPSGQAGVLIEYNRIVSGNEVAVYEMMFRERR